MLDLARDDGVSHECALGVGCDVPRDLGDEVPVQGFAGRDSDADAGSSAADLPRAWGGDRAGRGVSGPCAYAGKRTAAARSCEAGAIFEGALKPDATG